MASAITRSELAVLVLGSVLVAVAMHWPLVLHLGEHVPKDTGDPLSQTWQVAWDGHALAHQPLRFFQANQFWPERDSLAFSDALVGYAPAGLIGSGVTAAVTRYDLLFLFAYALAAVGAYLLGRELGLRPAAAAVAGAAFAYAPWRLEQDGHLHVISSGAIPLTLFLLLHGYRHQRPWLVLAGWAVAAWQLALGLTLGLQLAYLLGLLAAIAAVAWWRRGRPRPPLPRSLVRATAAGLTLFALTAVVLARPYLRVTHDHPESHRSSALVAVYSGPLKQFAAASGENLVWGPVTAPIRRDLPAVAEQTLFPGVVIVVLALLGATWRGFDRRLRLGLAIAAAASFVLILGFPDSAWRWAFPYWYLYDLAPGWKAFRVPGRLMTLETLALALLAGAGAQRLLARTTGRTATAIAAALVALVLIEGSGFDLDGTSLAGPANPAVPPAPAGQAGAPAPQLHLPLRAQDNRRYLLWSTDGFPLLVNGRSSFMPRRFAELSRDVKGFPDAASVARLKALGVRTVILHQDALAGTPWAAWRSRPVASLGLRREVRGGVVLYDIPRS